jgi:AraC-like DNA-binding protein
LNPITLDDISKEFFISKSYFSKAFKSVTGFTFTEHLNNIRVREARLLLRGTNSNVSEIAFKVGFESITHFGRVFKSIAGYSPLKYRNLSINKADY